MSDKHRHQISSTIGGHGVAESHEGRLGELAVMIKHSVQALNNYLDVDESPIDGAYTLYVQIVPEGQERE